MKTITNKQKNKSVVQIVYLVVFCVLGISALEAQVQTNGSLFIGNDAAVYVGSGNYTFGSGGATQTTRTAGTYGKLILASGSTTSGAADTHFLNGYGSIRTTSAFTIPVGQSGVYAPLRLTPTTTAAIDAAYVRSSAVTIGATLDASVSAVSTVEYWNVKGTNSATVTLTWRGSSNLSSIGVGTATSNLSIVAYETATSKWVVIPSTVDFTSILGGASSITTGSITSTAAVDLTAYEYFTLGAEENSCPPLVAFSGTTRTYSGGSWDVVPTLADAAVINSAYNSGSFVCNTLALNADVTLTDGQSVEIVNGTTGTGKIILSSQASLVQRNLASTAPAIELTKKSRNLMRRYDYIYWGTPIAENFFSQLNAAKASTAASANAFDFKYKYVTGAGTGTGWQPLTTTEVGRGFITRIKQQAPFTNATNTDSIDLKFTGTANNGDVTVAITNNTAFPLSGSSHVLLANPYPSAIDADKFLTENNAIDGAVYIWTAATSNLGGAATYSQADYIVYTLAGSVVPNSIATGFNGKIASGQGFKVRSLVNSGSVTFTNCMRLTGNNNNFYKSQKSARAPKDSFKLNMTGNNGVFSQILVAYLSDATLGYDRMYDAGRNSVSTAQLFSVFEGDGRRLAINARPTFDANDSVAIGVSKSATTGTETFTISITEKEGVFDTANQSVYIHDTQNNTYHDLNNGDFSLTLDKTNVDRYKLTYQAGTLSNPSFETHGVIARISNNSISFQSNQALTSYEVFDLTGRKIAGSKIEHTLTHTAPFLFPKAVYIVKAKLNNGAVASFKLITEN